MQHHMMDPHGLIKTCTLPNALDKESILLGVMGDEGKSGTGLHVRCTLGLPANISASCGVMLGGSKLYGRGSG